MATRKIKLTDPLFASLYKKNPDFDILNFDFHDKKVVDNLKSVKSAKQSEKSTVPMEELKAHQRLLRVYPDKDVAKALLEKGLDSAHRIASIPERKFVRENLEIFKGNEKNALSAHRKAVHIKSSVAQLYGLVKDTIASPHYRALNVNNTNLSLDDYFKQIPSYQDLFGNLDYKECDHCQSIFSPAAYFLDIMRIVDEYITDPNTKPVKRIPPGYSLEERRPDIFDLKLTCSNTNTIIPYLQVVNSVLEKNIKSRLQIEDTYQQLEMAHFPFNLPYNLPLDRIRKSFEKLGIPLTDVYKKFIDENKKKVTSIDYLREYLGISVSQLSRLTAIKFDPNSVSADYGYNIKIQPGDITGNGIIGFQSGQTRVFGVGTSFTAQLTVGDAIKSKTEIKKVVAIESDSSLQVDSNWSAVSGDVYTVIQTSAPVKPPYEGVGTVSFTPDNGIVKGVLTKFTSDFKVGDQIKAANLTKTVTLITSDTQLTVDSDWPYITEGAKYTVIQKAQDPKKPYQGTGIVLYLAGDQSLIGQGTTFTKDFSVNDKVQVNGIEKVVVQVVSDNQLKVNSAWSTTNGADYVITPQSVIESIESFLPKDGSGTLSFTIDSKVVSGKNTKFTSELQVGDQLKAADIVRTVETINSDTELTVDVPWGLISADVPFIIFRENGIDLVDIFVNRCSITQLQLESLFTQNLSKEEIKKGDASKFFINNTGEKLPNLRIYEVNDPANPVQRIEGLSLKRLDRLNRFIRLAKIVGWEYEELNWALIATGTGEIDTNLIVNIARISQLKAKTELTVIEIVALWFEIKAYGKVTDKNPQDLFDTIYNNPVLLNGQDPYQSDTVPFNPFRDPIQAWEINSTKDPNTTIRSRLKAALMINDDDLTKLANYVISLTGKPAGSAFLLNLENLSWLYSISKLAEILGFTIDEYLNLLCLLFYNSKDYLKPEKNDVPKSLAAINQILSASEWLKESPFTVYQIKYVGNGAVSSYFDPGYKPEDIMPFVSNLSVSSENLRLDASSLAIGGLTSDQATQVWDSLLQGSFINQLGIFKQYLFPYTKISQLVPVERNAEGIYVTGFTETSFVRSGGSITIEESKNVFAALKSHEPPVIVTESGSAVFSLSEKYNDSTDLSFLKEVLKGDQAEFKIEEIKQILLQTRSCIYSLMDVLSKILVKQQEALFKGLSEFLNTSQETAKSLQDLAIRYSGLTEYLVAFLTPPAVGAKLPDNLKKYIELISQWLQIVDNLLLKPVETQYITSESGASHFNIENLRVVTMFNIMSIDSYKHFANSVNDSKNLLINYFKTPKSSPCPNPKIDLLSKITNWPSNQICTLNEYFWPSGVDTKKDYDTIAGLNTLDQCFDAGKLLKTDMETLTGLCGLSNLPVLDAKDEIIKNNWKQYEFYAKQSTDLLSAKFQDNEFNEISKEIPAQINTNSRNALLGYAIWLINASNPSITKPSDLFQYLLIDVEMSGCADTSLIEQAIATVQLYMQRCRMMLEPGIINIDVPKIWWQWMSSYRIWEVNRKIFLYPENYIEPSLRKHTSPDFKQLSDDLLQNEITKENVVKPFQDYFNKLTILGNLEHIASYSCTRIDPDSGEEMETLFLFGRTNTQPYTYYVRALNDGSSWEPWSEIKLSISSRKVSPVYAFGRLFIFWLEFDVSKSNSINDQKSNTETVNKATIKYSFLWNKEWVQPQILTQSIVTNAFPYNYASIINEKIVNLLNNNNQFWKDLYVVSTGNGMIGSGTVGVSKGLGVVDGTYTQFEKEIKVGDKIWCLGEERIVGAIQDDKTLVVTEPWTVDSQEALYKVIPANQSDYFKPYIGTGKVNISPNLMEVTGINTRFYDEFNYGDKIVCGNESKIVILIQSNTSMLVDSNWQSKYTDAEYTVVSKRDGGEKILVLFGAPLETSYSIPFSPPPEYRNPDQNTFLQERDEFNQQIYDTFRVAKKASPGIENIPGVATMGVCIMLDENLLKTSTRIIIADDKYSSTSTPLPKIASLDRTQATLKVQDGKNSLVNNYWGNNYPEMFDSYRPVGNEGKNLLYYIEENKAALINVTNQPGWFIFNNSDDAYLVQAQEEEINRLSQMLFMKPMPIPPDMLSDMLVTSGAYTSVPKPLDSTKYKFTRLSTNTISQLSQRLFAGGIDNLLSIESQQLPEIPFSRFYPAPGSTVPSNVIPPATEIMDFDGSFGLYFWEIFFHVPFLIAERLNGNKKYEDTLKWIQYIFNPTQSPDEYEDPSSPDRFWRFLPFRTMEIESLKEILTNKDQIRRYNFDPFDPDAIATYRHSAYAKAIVMKFIDNVIDWADNLFAMDTRESINQATNLYVLASDLLGKRPESKGKIPAPTPKSFNDIRTAYPDHIPQFLIELENSNKFNWEGEHVVYSNVPFNDINSYFCVPENSDFIKYWDRVEDRLFKIRHCMNIDGVVRSLALFEPPIDPRALIRALSSGSTGLSVASQLSQPIPNYRFEYLLEKARAYANLLSAFGNALLSAIEKKDAEELSLLRIQQEKAILNLTTSIREQEIKEAQSTRDSLTQSLASSSYRHKYYVDIIAKGISVREQVSMDAMLAAMVFNILGSITKTAASIGYAVPQLGSPFAMTYGGQQIGNALNAASGVMEIGATISNFIAQQAQTLAGYDRRNEEWGLQEKLSGFEINQIAAQLKANEYRIAISEQSLKIHQENIKQNEENELFLKNKFTNKELYQWLVSRISTVYFQSYNLAVDMAMAAQRAFQYEYNTDQTFINFGYWDSLHKGLGAADGLLLALNQMEKNQIDRANRSLEIEKNISLMQLNPKALLDLRNSGECMFELSEKLYDYDFPGHYIRKIKTISISIPAIVGPYQNIKATLTQLSNHIVIKNDNDGLNAVNFLLGGKDAKTPVTDVLRSNWKVNQQIALSSGINDNGMFELNFNDLRYLPFEGTGAVSTWILSMPKATNRINFETISDIVIKLRYTASEGGMAFRQKVTGLSALKPYSGIGYLDLAQMYGSEWYKFMNDHTSDQTQKMNFTIQNFVPEHISTPKLRGFYVKILADESVAGSYMNLQITDKISVKIDLSDRNDFNYDFKADGKQAPAIDSVINANRVITFNLPDTPANLKDSEGKFLDPQKLKSIQIILYYDGVINF